jgi:hypothetical protein
MFIISCCDMRQVTTFVLDNQKSLNLLKVNLCGPCSLQGFDCFVASGRRDFGEFSVYNPTKRLSTE